MLAAVAEPRRVIVVGGPGSGKTTVAGALARRLGVDHVELDALWWGPDWTPVPVDAFTARVRAATAGDSWVLDGNYFDVVPDLVWPLADTLVWLDLPRARCVARTLLRTAGRIVRRRSLWGTNRQRVRDLGPRSVIGLVRRWPTYSAGIAALVSRFPVDHPTVVRLTSVKAVRRWLGGGLG